jgi:hypothetical protein
MTNLAETVAANSSQLTADDLVSGPRILHIRNVSGTGIKEQPIDIYFEGDEGKPFKPCKTIRRVLLFCWGEDGKSFVGKSMEVYRDPNVKFGGLVVGGIRVRKLSHIKGKQVVPVQASKGAKVGYTVLPLTIDTPAVDTPAEALTLDGARSLVEDAPDLAKLEWVWRQKSMTPFRDELAETLAFRKSQLTPVVDAGGDEGFVE